MLKLARVCWKSVGHEVDLGRVWVHDLVKVIETPQFLQQHRFSQSSSVLAALGFIGTLGGSCCSHPSQGWHDILTVLAALDRESWLDGGRRALGHEEDLEKCICALINPSMTARLHQCWSG